MTTIQKEIVKQGKRSSALPAFNAKNEKEMIAAWGRELDRTLLIFNVRLVNLVGQSLRALLPDGVVN